MMAMAAHECSYPLDIPLIKSAVCCLPFSCWKNSLPVQNVTHLATQNYISIAYSCQIVFHRHQFTPLCRGAPTQWHYLHRNLRAIMGITFIGAPVKISLSISGGGGGIRVLALGFFHIEHTLINRQLLLFHRGRPNSDNFKYSC